MDTPVYLNDEIRICPKDLINLKHSNVDINFGKFIKQDKKSI